MNDQPSAWRGDFDRSDLSEANAPANPLALFSDWFEAAQESAMKEPSAMTLATVDPDGAPSARIVLLRGYDDKGFRFYTNYSSAKGVALDSDPRAALVFWWEACERQVRVAGSVEKLPTKDSNAYFDRRPRGSQISALASPQSQVVTDRGALESHAEALATELGEQAPERPDHWGGYNLAPASIEFWQARKNRLHDRLRYRRESHGWRLERLAP
ncbi:pyridoxamine 5'-phosphate oxidase [Salinisphaera sp. USBA-960]|uniref:pyridoxamine 5'-phosphate oxidase n=1 Tax=Salinisphaera orenii TaxID=856731 RepID=UPI000DBE1F9E|nr:pyridoxamine 5'-phosphate oxidase [Salifodinibacter halophilus]NNC27156.1 pyridoxamine 5'-phosphate oxidase [Salifodinibacter halophilus]